MLMEIYTVEEFDKIHDWIEKVSTSNKVMEGLYEHIQEIKNKARGQFLEANKYYNAASLEIFGESQGLNFLQ